MVTADLIRMPVHKSLCQVSCLGEPSRVEIGGCKLPRDEFSVRVFIHGLSQSLGGTFESPHVQCEVTVPEGLSRVVEFLLNIPGKTRAEDRKKLIGAHRRIALFRFMFYTGFHMVL